MGDAKEMQNPSHTAIIIIRTAMENTSILIVEDEGIVAMNIKLSLIGKGYKILPIALSGKTALDTAEKYKPDLVLMDILLRGRMDGIETAELITARHNIPVIYVTAHADGDALKRASKTRYAGILKKPVEDRELLAAIEEALHDKSP